jgi:hypothetical protein
MRLTGHKTRALFDRYDIVHESDLRAATAKLNALMGTSSGPTRKANPASQRRGKPEEIDVKEPAIRAPSSVVEHVTFNHGVLGSIPRGPTMFSGVFLQKHETRARV